MQINGVSVPIRMYFGRKWDAAMFDDGIWVKVDVEPGQNCPFCYESIEPDGDIGLIVLAVLRMSAPEDHPCAELVPVHMECHVRSVMGNVEHLEGRCLCGGGDGHWPSPMPSPYRDEARAVIEWCNTKRAAVGMGPL